MERSSLLKGKTMEPLTQKVCPRCRTIFMGTASELTCMICNDSINRATARKARVHHQTQPPANPVLECLIKREGATIVHVGGCQYTFRPNDAGDSVCKITNPNHHKFLIKSGHYQPYIGSEL